MADNLSSLVAQGLGALTLLVVALYCLACGLYNAAEWLEDHTRTSYRVIRRLTQWCAAVQLLWLLGDRAAWLPNALGLLSHADSWLLLRQHPNHELGHPLSLAAVALLLAHQTSWILWWFGRGGSGWQVACVLAGLVWPVPTMLLLSSASGEALPTAGSLEVAAAAAATPTFMAERAASWARRRHASGGLAGVSDAGGAAAAAAAAASSLHLPGGRLLHHHLQHHNKPLLPDTLPQRDQAGARDQGAARVAAAQDDGGLLALLRAASWTAGFGQKELPSPSALLAATAVGGGGGGGAAGAGGLPPVAARPAARDARDARARKQKPHRSRVLRAFEALHSLARRHALLPVTEVDAAAAAADGEALLVAPRVLSSRFAPTTTNKLNVD